MTKLRWKNALKPRGKFSSFDSWAWPSAHYENGKPAAIIYCDDSFNLIKAKSGNHRPLKLCVVDYTVTPWEWKTVKKRFNTLDEAKAAALPTIESNGFLHPDYK